MKKYIIALACVLVSLMSISASADWSCRGHNAKGQGWLGYGPTRAAASAQVMRICVRNSMYARNCVIDGCSADGSRGGSMMSGGWQCNVANARGQGWSAMGATRANAAANAVGICAANSQYARNCHITSCFRK